MTTYVLEPYKSVGNIDFGMSPSQVATTLGEQPTALQQLPDSVGTSELYKAKGLVVFYQQDDTVEAVEFSGPTQVSYEVEELDDRPLVGIALSELGDILEKADPDADFELPDVISPTLGLAFYIEDNKVESVLAYREGYFDG